MNLAESLSLVESTRTLPVEIIEEFVGTRFAAILVDSVTIASKPVAYKTIQVLPDVDVSITVVEVVQEGVIPPSAVAVLEVYIENRGDTREEFTLNFWYIDEGGRRAFELSRHVEIGPHESETLRVHIPFTSPGTYWVTAEARSVPDGDLLAWTQLTVTVPWLSVYFYVLIVVAVAIIGGSAIALILYLARNGMLIAAGAGAGASGGAVLLAKKRKPRVRVAEKSAGIADDDYYDLIVNVNLTNGTQGRLESSELRATFEFEIFNRSARKQKFVLVYYLVDMGGVRMPESALQVKIDKRKTDVRSAIVELPSPGAYALHVEARTLKGGLLGSDHVNVRSSL